jgi:hypothetical protein
LVRGTIEIGQCAVEVVHRLMNNVTIGVDRRLPGVELDGTIEIGKRSFETALLAEGHTPPRLV